MQKKSLSSSYSAKNTLVLEMLWSETLHLNLKTMCFYHAVSTSPHMLFHFQSFSGAHFCFMFTIRPAGLQEAVGQCLHILEAPPVPRFRSNTFAGQMNHLSCQYECSRQTFKAIRVAEHSFRYNLHKHGCSSSSAQKNGFWVAVDFDIV